MTGNAIPLLDRGELRRKTIVARVLLDRATDHYENLDRALLADEPDLGELRRELDELGTLLLVVLEELQELEPRG